MRPEDVKHEFVRYTRGHGLDLSNGPMAAFPHMLSVREKHTREPGQPHYFVDSFADLHDVIDASCDFILVAGLDKWYIDEWCRCLKDGGYLCLFDHKGRDSLLRETTNTTHPSLIRAGDHLDGRYMILRKGDWPSEKRPEKSACIVRHGGIGDMLQAAYLLPELKRQGYHVAMLTTPKGQNILREDPNVDDWFLIDDNQVPNHPGRQELAAFWSVTARHYDKFINLNESVEGTFLAQPGRPNHAWPHNLRHEILNRNYAEFAAKLAQIPFKPEGKFYPTAAEEVLAMELRSSARAVLARPMYNDEPVFVMMWVLAGSSPHKWTPHQDTILKMVLGTLKRAVMIMVGDLACKILETGWEQEPRVICKSGDMPIREVLALAPIMDLVVGPETGVMNAVCYADVPKIVMLSHSSQENLTKHWVDTKSIPGVAPCYPCHQLHHTTEFCPQDERLAGAICQSGVHPEHFFREIFDVYERWAKSRLVRAA